MSDAMRVNTQNTQNTQRPVGQTDVQMLQEVLSDTPRLRTNDARTAPSAPTLSSGDDLPARRAPNAASAKEVYQTFKTLPQVNFSIYELMALLFEVAQNAKRGQHIAMIAESNSAVQARKDAANDMREAAVMGLIGTMVKDSAQIGGSAVTMGGAAKTGGMTDSQMVMNKMAGYQGASQAMGSVGDAAKGGFDYEAGLEQSERIKDEAQAGRMDTIQQSDRQTEQEEGEIVQRLIQTFDKIEESKHEAMRSATA